METELNCLSFWVLKSGSIGAGSSSLSSSPGPSSISIEHLVEDYIYKYHFKMFPVVEDHDRLLGCVTTKQIKEIPREEWSTRSVGDTASQCSDENTIEPQADAMKAVAIMNRTGNSRLMVVEGGG